MIVKNSYGISIVIGTEQARKIDPFKSKFTGSSLDRKPTEKKVSKKKAKTTSSKDERRMSQRTKSKIRKKVMAFSQVNPRLTFATFTFLNQVVDEKAILIFRKFLDNMKKRKPGFEYLWVAERQNKNETFKGNIHFHMISNKFFKRDKIWNYWYDLQIRNGVSPRNDDFKPTSAFDIKSVSTKNPKNVGMYLTKYVTKNQDGFRCQVWNCSKGVSKLYTDFYSNYEFLDKLIEINNGSIRTFVKEYCTVTIIPINKNSMRFYESIKHQNQFILNKG